MLYSLAFPTNYLYLILIGRTVNGIAFSALMYNKKVRGTFHMSMRQIDVFVGFIRRTLGWYP